MTSGKRCCADGELRLTGPPNSAIRNYPASGVFNSVAVRWPINAATILLLAQIRFGRV